MHFPFLLATYFLLFPELFCHYSHVLLASLVIVILKRLLEKTNSTEILLPQAQQTAQPSHQQKNNVIAWS